jgi:DNA-binding XRE family transcriptional regulator
MQVDRSLDEALSAYKASTGTTYASMADSLGITDRSLQNKRHGIDPIRLDEAAKLAEMLGTSIDKIYEIAPMHIGRK